MVEGPLVGSMRLRTEYREDWLYGKLVDGGFEVRPYGGVSDLKSSFLVWECGIPFLAHSKVMLTFSENYPHVAPIVTFNPRVIHPNIDRNGKFQADFLTNGWRPQNTVKTILTRVAQLYNMPDPKYFDLLVRNQMGQVGPQGIPQ